MFLYLDHAGIPLNRSGLKKIALEGEVLNTKAARGNRTKTEFQKMLKIIFQANDCEMDEQEASFYHIVFEAGMYNDELEYIEVPERRKVRHFTLFLLKSTLRLYHSAAIT